MDNQNPDTPAVETPEGPSFSPTDHANSVDRSLDKAFAAFESEGDDDADEALEAITGKTPRRDEPDSESAEPEKPEPEKAAKTKEEPEEEPDTEPDTDAAERDEKGRFKSKKAGDEAEEGEAEEDEDVVRAEDADDDAGEPPSRFKPEAKDKWANAPKEVRDEVNRAIQEMEAGIQKYRVYADELSVVDQQNLEAIRGTGQTAGDVVNKALGYERMLQQDFVGGMEFIAKSFGHSIHDVAAYFMQQAPNADLSGMERQLAQAHGEINQLRGQVQQYERVQHETQRSQVDSTISDFFTQHPDAESIAPHIARVIEAGFADNLSEAYRVARRMYLDDGAASVPQVPQQQPAPEPRRRDPTAQTQKASKSISGAPSAGSNPGTKRPLSKSVEESVDRAFQDLGL